MTAAYDTTTDEGLDEFESLVRRTIETEYLQRGTCHGDFAALARWFWQHAKENPVIDPVLGESGYEYVEIDLVTDRKRARRLVRKVAKETLEEFGSTWDHIKN